MDGESPTQASAAAGAVFLSYASEDAAAAERIATALRSASIEVWFDQSELRGGDVWDQKIRRELHDCALFIPVISANTAARHEGYFRLEWDLADQRTHMIARNRAFIVPVCVDATAETSADTPESFQRVQWTRLPNGEASSAFIERVRCLLAGAKVPAVPAGQAVIGAPASPRRARALVAAPLLIAIAVLGAVTWLLRGTKPPGSAAEQTLSADRKWIAVLPFANLTGHAEDAYLADGLHEEILNALARIRELKVISRTSVAGYRDAQPNVHEISSRLGVGTVLEGSVRREGNTLRLTTQLINARDDRHLLATNYDRDLGHILGLQSEVARAVAEALTATLTAFERGELEHAGTNNGDAYRGYLKALALFMRPVLGDGVGVIQPARLLEEAVRLDPEFADAHALLSRVYTLTYVRSDHAADGERSRLAFQRALAIDPQLVDGRMARGLYELYVVRDIDQGLADLEPVARLRPNSPTAQQAMGFALRRRGRMAEAVPYFERAWDLDPLSDLDRLGAFLILLGLRRYPEALEQAQPPVPSMSTVPPRGTLLLPTVAIQAVRAAVGSVAASS